MKRLPTSGWSGGVASRLRAEAGRMKRRIVREPELIVVNTHGGLGNKLKALVSAVRLSDSVAATYPTFGFLFENEIPVVDAIPTKCRVFSGWRFVLTTDDRLADDFASVPIPERGQNKLRIPVGRSIAYEYGRIPAQLLEAFLAAFAKLTVRGEIERSVARVSEHWPHDTIAVHVRSWEGNDFRRNLLFDLERFFHAVDLRGAVPIFLGSDSPAVIDDFRRRYGSRVITASERRASIALGRCGRRRGSCPRLRRHAVPLKAHTTLREVTYSATSLSVRQSSGEGDAYPLTSGERWISFVRFGSRSIDGALGATDLWQGVGSYRSRRCS